MEKVQCITCGAMILPETAERNAGRCAPCKKESDAPVKVAPTRSAFVLAATVLFVNAATTTLTIATQKGMEPYAISVVIDILLGIFLFRLDERARYFTIIRAVGGLLVGGTFALLQYSGLVLFLVIFAQALLSGSLILLVAWETVRWRLIAGSVLAVLYFAYFLLAALGTVYAKNA